MHSSSKVPQERFLDDFSVHLLCVYYYSNIYVHIRYYTMIINYLFFFCIYKCRIVLISSRIDNESYAYKILMVDEAACHVLYRY